MNHATQSPLPASLSRIDSDAEQGDLDARILQAEQRLILREAHLRHGVAAFGQQVSAALKPSRLIQPAVMTAAVAVILLWWPSSRRQAAAQPAPHQAQAANAAPIAKPALFALMAGIPWTRVLSHAWPLLPGRWRERLNPATAASILTLGLPLLERLIARRRHEPARPG